MSGTPPSSSMVIGKILNVLISADSSMFKVKFKLLVNIYFIQLMSKTNHTNFPKLVPIE